MRLGIDARPMQGQKAGIGEYVAGLISGLAQIDHEGEYYLFSDQPLALNLPVNFQNIVIPASPIWHNRVAGVCRSKKLFFHATHSLIDAVLQGKKCILTVNDTTALDNARTHSLKVRVINSFLFSIGVRRAGAIISPTLTVKKDILKKIALPESKITVIFDAVSADFGKTKDKAVLAKYHLQEGYIFFNATLEPRKNLPRLLEAYSHLQNPPYLVLAGKKGWGSEDLEKIIADLKIKDKVKILGWVPDSDLSSLYGYARLFVYPSLAEGFGLSPLKAMKVGVPVLVSDLEVSHEVLGDSVLFVDPYNISELTTKMAQLLTDDKFVKQLITKGHERVKQFSWVTMAEKTLKVYQRLANENN